MNNGKHPVDEAFDKVFKEMELDDLEAQIIQLTEQVADHLENIADLIAERESMQTKIDAYDKVLESHINFLLRLSAFDAPEARSLAATLQLERAELKGDSY